MCELMSAVSAFNAELNSITCPNRAAIRHITEMAYELAPYCGVNAVCGFIRKLPANNKLLGIFIMDSIIKCQHDATTEYRRLFDEKLVKLMVATFKKMDVMQRLPFYSCRRTWESRFSEETLANLDRRINAIDPAWPVAAPVANPLPSSAPPCQKELVAVENTTHNDSEMIDASELEFRVLIEKMRNLCLVDS